MATLEGSDLHVPHYLPQVEELIELPFSSDAQQEAAFLARPQEFDPILVEPYIPLYWLGLTALQEERREGRVPSRVQHWKQREYEAMRQNQQHKIHTIRSGLMVLDPALATPEVRAVQAALREHEATRSSQPFRIAENVPRDALPPWEIPLHTVEKLMKIKHGAALASLTLRNRTVQKRNLPGFMVQSETCISWADVRDLARNHELKPAFAAVAGKDFWQQILLSADDARPGRDERVAFAREMQLRFVPPEKLVNLPVFDGRLPRIIEPARAAAHHVSRHALSEMMGGGYNFIADAAEARDIAMPIMRRARGKGPGYAYYLTLEEAGVVWHDYMQIPQATEDDVKVLEAATDIGLATKEPLLKALYPAELEQVRDMRAIEPRNRLLLHMPRTLAQVAQGRMRPLPLPAHLVPVGELPRLVDMTYSGIMRAIEKMDKVITTRLRPDYSSHPQVLVGWPTVARLQADGRRATLNAPIIHAEELPPGPYDTDPARVANARSIQIYLLGTHALQSALAETPKPIVPLDLPDSYRLRVGLGQSLEGILPTDIDAYALAHDVSVNVMEQVAKKAGVAIHDTVRDGQRIGILLPDAKQRLDAYIASLPPPRPGWYRPRQVASALGVTLQELGLSPNELIKTHPEHLAALLPQEGALLTQQHIATAPLVAHARRIIMKRLATDPSTPVTLTQLAMMGNTDSQSLYKRLAGLGWARSATVPYQHHELLRILDLLQLSPPPTFLAVASQMAVRPPRPIDAPVRVIPKPVSEATTLAVVFHTAEEPVPSLPAPSETAMVAPEVAPEAALPEAQEALVVASEMAAEPAPPEDAPIRLMRPLPPMPRHLSTARPLDTVTIAAQLQVDVRVVRDTIETLGKSKGGLPVRPVDQRDKHGFMTPHYSGASLTKIEDIIAGVDAHEVARRLDLPVGLVMGCAHVYGVPLNAQGRFSLDNVEAIHSVLKAPAGWQPLHAQHKGATDEASALRFLLSHGARQGQFYGADGARTLYINAYGVQLLARNSGQAEADCTEPPIGWLTREQLAEQAGVDVLEIDLRLERILDHPPRTGLAVPTLPDSGKWFRSQKKIGTPHMVWVSNSQKVILPYYNPALSRLVSRR